MRKLLPLLLLSISLSALGKEDVLHLYNWNDYIAPETSSASKSSVPAR